MWRPRAGYLRGSISQVMVTTRTTRHRMSPFPNGWISMASFQPPIAFGGLLGCNSTDIGILLVANMVYSHTIGVSRVGLSAQVVLRDVMLSGKGFLVFSRSRHSRALCHSVLILTAVRSGQGWWQLANTMWSQLCSCRGSSFCQHCHCTTQ